jgi:hypothetical protein
MATGRIPTTANSPLTVKGDLFGYSTTQARVPVGNDGETLVADSSTSTGLRYGANFAAGKNNLLNGNMQIAQRGTSFTGVTNQVYPADRYWFETSGAGTYTVTNESDAPTVLGQSKCVKVLVTTANASPGASAYTVFQSAIEGQASQFLAKGTASAQISTISFWTKSNKTGTYSFLLYDAVNARAFGANYTISVSGTWEKKTITVPADLTGTITNNNGVGIRLYWNLNAGSNHTGGSVLSAWGAFSFGTNWMPNQTNIAANLNNYWQITGIQWELGSTATAFQTATGTIQGELAACQRYYWRSTPGNSYGDYGLGTARSTTQVDYYIQCPVQLRIAPTSLDYSGLAVTFPGVSASTITNLVLDVAGPLGSILAATVASGLTQFRTYHLMNNNNSAGYVGLSAEL